MTQEKTLFTFYSEDKLSFEEITLKGIKRYFIEGYASTIDKDLAGEIINDSAQRSMLNQFRNRNITLDIEHAEFYDDEGNKLDKPKSSMIPVAKIINAKKDNKGTWIKAEINSHIKEFKEIWGSIKDGFLNAFSIAFFPISQAGNVISDLNIINVTITGTPVNPQASFTPVMKSAREYLKKLERENEKKMTIKMKSTEGGQPVPEPVTPVVPEPVTPAVTAPVAPVDPATILPVNPTVKPNENNIPKDQDISALINDIMDKRLKEFEAKFKPAPVVPEPAQVAPVPPEVDPVAPPAKPENVVNPLSMIKAFEKRKQELSTVPNMKSLVENTPVDETTKRIKKINPLQLI